MTKAAEFQLGHLDVFSILETDDINPSDWEAFKRDMEYISESKSMEVISIVCDNEITAIVGAKSVSQGVVQVWMIPGKTFKQHRIATHKEIKRLLDVVGEENHRTQITVREDFKVGVDWAIALGFKYESVLVEYDNDGTNHRLYVRF